ncbi:MAG: hypothetical protein V1747_02195 [Candidatus Omnitrophota bacterium]
MRKNNVLKIIGLLLINLFLLLDIAWAGGTELLFSKQTDCLSPELNLNLALFMDSFALQASSNPLHISSVEKIGFWPLKPVTFKDNFFLYGNIYGPEMSIGEFLELIRQKKIIINVKPVNVSKTSCYVDESQARINVVDVYAFGNPNPIWSRKKRPEELITPEELARIKDIRGVGFRIQIENMPLTSGIIMPTFYVHTAFEDKPAYATAFGEPLPEINIEDVVIGKEEMSKECLGTKNEKGYKYAYLNNESNSWDRIYALKMMLYYANKNIGEKAHEILNELARYPVTQIRHMLAKDLKNFDPSPVASELISILSKDVFEEVSAEALKTRTNFARKLQINGGIEDRMRNPVHILAPFLVRVARSILNNADIPEKEKQEIKSMNTRSIMECIDHISDSPDYKLSSKEAESLKVIFEMLKLFQEIEVQILKTIAVNEDEIFTKGISADEYVYELQEQMGRYIEKLEEYWGDLKENSHAAKYTSIIESGIARFREATNNFDILSTVTSGALKFKRQDLDELIGNCKKEFERKRPGITIFWDNKMPRKSEVVVCEEFSAYLNTIIKNALSSGAKQVFITAESINVAGELLEPVYNVLELRVKYDGENIAPGSIYYMFELFTHDHSLNTDLWNLRRSIAAGGGNTDVQLLIDEQKKQWVELTMQIPVVGRLEVLNRDIESLHELSRKAYQEIRLIRSWFKDNPKGKIVVAPYGRLLRDISNYIRKYRAGTQGFGLSDFLKILRAKRQNVFEVHNRISELEYLSSDFNLIEAFKNISSQQLEHHLAAADVHVIQEELRDMVKTVREAGRQIESDIKEGKIKEFSPLMIANFMIGKYPLKKKLLIVKALMSYLQNAENNSMVKWAITSGKTRENLQKELAITQDMAVNIFTHILTAIDQLEKRGDLINASAIVKQLEDDKREYLLNNTVEKGRLINILNNIIHTITAEDLKSRTTDLMRKITEILAYSYRTTESFEVKTAIQEIIADFRHRLPEAGKLRINFLNKTGELGEVLSYKSGLRIMLSEFLNSAAFSRAEEVEIDVREQNRELAIEIYAIRPKVDVVSKDSKYCCNLALFSEITHISGGRWEVIPAAPYKKTTQPCAIFKIYLPIQANIRKLSIPEPQAEFVSLTIGGTAGSLRIPASFKIGSRKGYKNIVVGDVIRALGYFMLKDFDVITERGPMSLEKAVQGINWDKVDPQKIFDPEVRRNIKKLEKFKKQYLEALIDFSRDFLAKRMDFTKDTLFIDNMSIDLPADAADAQSITLRREIQAKFSHTSFMKFLHTIANDPRFYTMIEQFLLEKRKDIKDSKMWRGVIYAIGPRLWQDTPGLFQFILSGTPEERSLNIPIDLDVIADMDLYTIPEGMDMVNGRVDVQKNRVIYISGKNTEMISDEILSVLGTKEHEGFFNVFPFKSQQDNGSFETAPRIESAI